jgi:membrane-associated phospholipid phosphatase
MRLRGWREGAVVAALLGVAAASGPRTEQYGDGLQVALPVAALGCDLLGGGAGALLARFAGTMAVVHGSKNGLGDAEVNLRPSGGHRGLPSGHTASAAFGASALVSRCLEAPLARAGVVLAAGFVGGSRIEAGAHDTAQVVAGAAVGVAGERMARSRRTRERLAAAWSRIAAVRRRALAVGPALLRTRRPGRRGMGGAR